MFSPVLNSMRTFVRLRELMAPPDPAKRRPIGYITHK